MATFLLWGIATASLVAWGLAFWPNDGKPLVGSIANGPAVATREAADLGKVLGVGKAATTKPESPSLVSRLVLVGVAKSGSEISALIAVDGQPAKPFAKGMEVLPGLMLQSVTLQQAQLGAGIGGSAQLSLDMPKRAEPARGMVP